MLDPNIFSLGQLEETTGTSSYNVLEGYLAGLEMQEPSCPWMKQLIWLRIVHS